MAHPAIRELTAGHSADLVKYCIRGVVGRIRQEAFRGKEIPGMEEILAMVGAKVQGLVSPSLRRVVNATGILIHTNMGRAPFSDAVAAEATGILKGYNNLEFDLESGKRKTRYFHITERFKYLTGAGDVLVVNNNAAAVMMILRSFAKGRDVIVSRGELIEIGGSFRLPEIMAASDCHMVEVGTTNKTCIEDYEKAITPSAALLFKAHRSNYVIRGFTREAALEELVSLGKKHRLPVVYDMGSGLLRKSTIPVLEKEPDVKQTLKTGVDLVTFSGDKLLGAAQAGIIAGKKELIGRLRREPMLRALRVDKTTLALLESSLLAYLDEDRLKRQNIIFSTLTKDREQIKKSAEALQEKLQEADIRSVMEEMPGHIGGGALPGEEIPAYALRLLPGETYPRKAGEFSETMYHALMKHERPVVGILKKGALYIHLLTVFDDELSSLATVICETYQEIQHP